MHIGIPILRLWAFFHLVPIKWVSGALFTCPTLGVPFKEIFGCGRRWALTTPTADKVGGGIIALTDIIPLAPKLLKWVITPYLGKEGGRDGAPRFIFTTTTVRMQLRKSIVHCGEVGRVCFPNRKSYYKIENADLPVGDKAGAIGIAALRPFLSTVYQFLPIARNRTDRSI